MVMSRIGKWRPIVCGLGVGVALMCGAARAEARCLLHASHLSLEAVTVHPSAGDSFKLDLQSVPALIQIPKRAEAFATIEVERPLKFTAHRKHLWLSLLEDFTSADGLVVIRRGAKLVHARVDGDSVLAAAVEYTDDVLPGEDKDAEKYVSAIRLPCSILTLDDPEAEIPEQAEASAAPEATWWEPKTATNRVRPYAGPWLGARSVDIVDETCAQCIDFIQVGERGAWLNVARYAEGVVTRGWIRRSALKKSPPELVHGHSSGCAGEHGPGLGGEHRPVLPVYQGPATLRAATRIFAEPAYGLWATVTEDIPARFAISQAALGRS